MWLDSDRDSEEIPEVWSYFEVHRYNGDIVDLLNMFTDTQQKIKLEPLTDANGQPVAKITPRNMTEYGQYEIRKILYRLFKDNPGAEVVFY